MAESIVTRIVTRITKENNVMRDALLDRVAEIASECKRYTVCGEKEKECLAKLDATLQELSLVRRQVSGIQRAMNEEVASFNQARVAPGKSRRTKPKTKSEGWYHRTHFEEDRIKELVEKTPWIKEQYKTRTPKEIGDELGISHTTIRRIANDTWTPGKRYIAEHVVKPTPGALIDREARLRDAEPAHKREFTQHEMAREVKG